MYPRRRRPPPLIVGLLGLATGLLLGTLLAPLIRPATPPPTPRPPTVQQATETAPDVPADPASPATTDQVRTEEGAVAAALSWTVQFTPTLYLDGDARRQAVAAIAATDAEQDLQTITADIAQRFRDAGITPEVAAAGLRRVIPAGYAVRSFDGDRAEVAIWLAQVTDLEGVAPLSLAWDTQVTTLRWEDDAWRLVSVDSSDGPVPELAAQGDGQLAQTITAIQGLEEFTHVP